MDLSNVKLIPIPTHSDSRGALSSIEALQTVPIEIKRVFYIHHVLDDRGGHANIDTDQVLIPLSGSFRIRLYDAHSSGEYLLDDPQTALYIPRLIFLEMFDYSKDSVVMVLANTAYDSKMYLRSKEAYYDFIKSLQNK